MNSLSQKYDAILVVSFGGPEQKKDVIPFLENVLRGKNVPRERLLEVAEHYYQFGGVSPINEQNRQLISALASDLQGHGIDLPIYWGNRNWDPLLADTLRTMRKDGVTQALAFVTSVFSSYSGCRQYLEDIELATATVGDGCPRVDKIRSFFNHPGYIETIASNMRESLTQIPPERHASTELVFAAHSIPNSMADNCDYAAQFEEASRLVSEAIGHSAWSLVYQSRSGPPHQPWLEPDICDYLRQRKATGEITDVIVSPIGFISDHMEVLFDLDTEAKQVCDEIGLGMVRSATAGTHPRFITMIRELIEERIVDGRPPLVIGAMEPTPHTCPADCCPSGRSRRP